MLGFVTIFSHNKLFLPQTVSLKKAKIMGCYSLDMNLYMMNLKQSKYYDTGKLK